MSDLHLHVKTEYFEAVKRGEKTEEYRLRNTYWMKRLFHWYGADGYAPSGVAKVFDGVVIHNAYKSGDDNRLTFPWRGFTIRTITHPHFGSEPVAVFAIKLEK
jgi:hypothetical protein